MSKLVPVLSAVIGSVICTAGIFCLDGFLNRCHACERWNSKKVVHKEVIGETVVSEDVYTKDSSQDVDGSQKGFTVKKKSFYVKRVTYDVTSEC